MPTVMGHDLHGDSASCFRGRCGRSERATFLDVQKCEGVELRDQLGDNGGGPRRTLVDLKAPLSCSAGER